MTSIIDLSKDQVPTGVSSELAVKLVEDHIIEPYLVQIKEDQGLLLVKLWAAIQSVQLAMDELDSTLLDANDLSEVVALGRVNAGFAHFILMCEVSRQDGTPVEATVLASFAFQITCHVEESLMALRMAQKAQNGSLGKSVRLN